MRGLSIDGEAPRTANLQRKARAAVKMPAITEKRFMQQIIDLARMNHWVVFHPFFSRFSTAGFPDLLLIKRPRLIVAEIKTERGKVEQAQLDWLAEFRACGIPAFLWRPSQWSEIEQALGATTPPPARAAGASQEAD